MRNRAVYAAGMPYTRLRYGDWPERPDGREKLFLTMPDAYWAMGYRIGWGRHYPHRGEGDAYIPRSSFWAYRSDKPSSKGEAATEDIMGACGEVAGQLLFGHEPDERVMLLRQDRWAERRSQGHICDVDGCEVRTADRRDKRLIIHRDMNRDGRDTRDTIFILILVDPWPFHEARGFRTGHADIDAALRRPRAADFQPLPHYRGEVAFVGWAYGREVGNRPNFDRMPLPQPAMEQKELHLMRDLPRPLRTFPTEDELLIGALEATT